MTFKSPLPKDWNWPCGFREENENCDSLQMNRKTKDCRQSGELNTSELRKFSTLYVEICITVLAYISPAELFLISEKGYPSVYNLLHFNLLLRTTWAISTKFGANHPWIKGIQICSNKRPCPFPRIGYYSYLNSEITSMTFKNLF